MSRIGLALVTSMLLGCATTKLESTWKDPGVRPGSVQGRRVAAVVMTTNEGMRRVQEDALAQALMQQGLQAVPSYKLVEQAPSDPKELVRQIRESGLDAAVVMRVLGQMQEVDYQPVTSPFYVYVSDLVSVQTSLYSVPDGRLLWAGVTRTSDPDSVGSLIRQVVRKAVPGMRQSGLLI